MKKLAIGLSLLLFASSSNAALFARDLDGNISNGHEAVYDDLLNVTWLADANLAATNTFGVQGIGSLGHTSWAIAHQWIAAMNASSNGSGYLGIKTWRLPKARPVAPIGNNGFNLNAWNGGGNFNTYDGSTDTGYWISAPVSANNPNGQSAGFLESELAYHYYNNFEAIGRCSGTGLTCNHLFSSSEYGIENAPDTSNNLVLFDNVQNHLYWAGIDLVQYHAGVAFHMGSGRQLMTDRFSQFHLWAVAPGDVYIDPIPISGTAWLFGSSLLGLFGIRVSQ